MPETSLDDTAEVAPGLAGAWRSPAIVHNHRPPPPEPPWALPTPVSRFDKLLN